MAEIQVELLKASYGDCIFININYDGKSFVIMIDGGPSYSYRHKERGRMKPGALQDKLDVPARGQVRDIKGTRCREISI